MRKIRNTIRIALLAIAAAACSEEANNSPTDVELRIVPQVTGATETRAAVAGSTFGPGAQVGLRIESASETLNSMYNSFYADYNGTDWRYFLNDINIGTKLSGFSNWGTIKVMGYYPYDARVTNFNAIPFEIAGADGVTSTEKATVDYMVAKTEQKAMTNDGMVTLQFEHLMTYVYFYLNRSYQGPELILSKVTLDIDRDRKFIVEGTYNACEPNMDNIPALITPGIRTNRLEIETNHTIPSDANPNTSYTTIPLVIMPQLTNADGEAAVTVTLYFTETDGTPFLFDDRGNPQMIFELSDVNNGTSSDKGFLRGKQYRLAATLGTYVHFKGVPIVDELRPMKEGDESDEQHIDI